MTSARELALRSGRLGLALAPELGGAVTRFWTERPALHELFRRAVPEAVETFNPLGLACFPLVPFSNRIERGRFAFDGRQFEVAPNLPPHPHPLHGHGWRAAWQVTAQGDDFAELELTYAGSDWPSAYRSRQRFELRPTELRARVVLVNEGPGDMPAGIGLHPYFDRTPRTTLEAKVEGIWLADEECIPREHASVPSAADFSAGRALSELVLDHCFSGWGGCSTIDWPERGLRLRMQADSVFGHLVVYVPQGQGFFCVEPVSHANDALNLASRGIPSTGLHVLRPGEALEGEVRFQVEG